MLLRLINFRFIIVIYSLLVFIICLYLCQWGWNYHLRYQLLSP